ncbi:MAG: AAA family ATPase [Streptosporangiaceae bacterium]|nr:AAA family ATPase [Streptosporangiaceae bacterium]
MTRRPRLSVIGSADARRLLAGCHEDTPLTEALAGSGCLLGQPLSADLAALPLRAIQPDWIDIAAVRPDTPVYFPSVPAGASVPVADQRPRVEPTAAVAAAGPSPASSAPAEPASVARPVDLTPETATQVAYRHDVNEVAAFLRADLSVLVICEKAVVRYLAEHMVRTAGREPRVIQASPAGEIDTEADADDGGRGAGTAPGAGGLALFNAPVSMGQREMTQLRDELRALKELQVLIIPHLDLLAGGAEGFGPASTDVRELTELLYASPEAVILAFADPSLTIPEVLAARFSRRLSIEGTDRMVPGPGGTAIPVERALITEAEADRFRGIDDTDFYKHVAGLNPVRIRQAMRYAMLVHESKPRATASDLHDTIRTFKSHLATGFQIPDTTFDQIGGYEDVKQELREALHIMAQVQHLPEEDGKLKSSLVPRGFIFHGPAGTGKTLLAKAVASEMRGTIQVVSGPELTSKWVGEGERKVRDLFAEARRNAPSVIVFDEFDSIATRRSSSADDGGSRAANAMVAQILTEMDGFRPEVPMIVIGTTNRLDIIDPALLRPSRFRSFHVSLPDEDARLQIIRVHAAAHRIDVGGGLAEAIAKGTEGWNGDELRSLFRNAYVAKWLRHVPADDPSDLARLLATLAAEIGRSKEGQHVSRGGH